MLESDASRRLKLKRSALAFSISSRIGALAILSCVFLAVTAAVVKVPSTYWSICFATCVVALIALVAGHVILAWNSLGYGFEARDLTYLFWLLVLCGLVSTAFAFTGNARSFALGAFGVGSLVCVALTPLLHHRFFS
jgi:hypothetical protein